MMMTQHFGISPVKIGTTTAMLVLALMTVPAHAQDQISPAPSLTRQEAVSDAKAKNVIIFLADAAGVSALNGASIMGYGKPLQLHIQRWPHLGLSETSAVDNFVSDSANGMSSIMTGVKTRNGVISQSPTAIRGQRDGAPIKTILEYAEERGLMTGVVSSQSIADATPAAAFAHANDRRQWASIFKQAFTPRFGNGVDVLLGAGRQRINEQLIASGSSLDKLAQMHDRPIFASLGDIPAATTRPVVVADKIDTRAATLQALDILEKSPQGYFLVVEWDAHTDDPKDGLQNLVDFDKLIAEVQTRVDLKNTLLLFTADHSFGFQIDGGMRGKDIMEGYDVWKNAKNIASPDAEETMVRLKNILVNDSHTAEEVPALAIGAGAERVRGYFANTHLFTVMMNALGWQPDQPVVE
jgi:alkaline phosphatase